MGFLERAARTRRMGMRRCGEPVAFTPSGGSPITTTLDGRELRGVFDPSGSRAVLQGGVELEVVTPILDLHLADLPDGVVQHGAQWTARGVDYEVVEIEPDGLGGVTLVGEER